MRSVCAGRRRGSCATVRDRRATLALGRSALRVRASAGGVAGRRADRHVRRRRPDVCARACERAPAAGRTTTAGGGRSRCRLRPATCGLCAPAHPPRAQTTISTAKCAPGAAAAAAALCAERARDIAAAAAAIARATGTCARQTTQPRATTTTTPHEARRDAKRRVATAESCASERAGAGASASASASASANAPADSDTGASRSSRRAGRGSPVRARAHR